MKPRSRILLVAVVMGATGCNGLITQSPAFTVHDLGVAPQGELSPAVAPAAIEVVAPSWLSSSAMQYRLEYAGPGGRESFGESRWAGHPSEMLQRWLVSSLTPDTPGTNRCRLTLELDEFVQRFPSPGESVSEAALRAKISGPRDETVLARRTFGYSIAAPTIDAHGGVIAHRAGAKELSVAVANWLKELGSPEDQSTADRCMR